MSNNRRRFYSDLLERVVWTALQSFVGAMIADGLGAGLDNGDKLKVAGLAALLSAAKCLLATQIGSGNTAATLPAEDDTPEPEGTRLLDDGHGDITTVVLVLLFLLVLLLAVGVLPAHAATAWT